MRAEHKKWQREAAEGVRGYCREVTRNFRFKRKRLFSWFAPCSAQSHAGSRPSSTHRVPLRKWSGASSQQMWPLLWLPVLVNWSVGCISSPCMLCCVNHKCTALLEDPVHTMKWILSKAAGFWNVEKDMFCHEKQGICEWQGRWEEAQLKWRALQT